MKKQECNHLPTYLWVKEDQPRYKLIRSGSTHLSDAEILSLIISSGNRTVTSLDMSRTILNQVGNNLSSLGKLDMNSLLSMRGMGVAKATAIIAAIELGKRKNASEVITKAKITSSKDAFELFKSILGDIPYEKFYMIMLNKANRIIDTVMISEGGVSGTVVDPKKIYKIALDNHSSSLILGHNHPSGNIQPSEADHKITQKIKGAGLLLDIAVIDHIIVGDDRYYSFADEGSL